MNTENPKLKEFNECFASLEKATNELKACMDNTSNPTNDKIANLANNMYASINSLRNLMWDLHDSHHKRMNDHMENHLPPIIGPDRMNKAIKALGLDGDYQVNKRQIFASTTKPSKKGLIVEVDFIKSKDK